MTRREEAIWIVVAGVFVLCGLVRNGGLLLGEDAYQYLSAARNLTDGRGLSTSLLHYDVEHSGGVVPAPLTMRPTGYSMAIGLVHSTGLSLETAAGWVSALAFAALIPILARAGRGLELSPIALRVAFLWLLTNSWVLVFPVAATSESLFTALSTAAVAVFVVAESGYGRPSARFLLAGSTLIGLAYWVRYAGLLTFAGLLIYYAAAYLFRRLRGGRRALICAVAPAAVLIAASAVRNTLLTGSWRSGYTRESTWTIEALVERLAASLHHLFFGDAVRARFGVVEAFFTLAVLVIAFQAMRVARRRTPAVAETTQSAVFLGTVLVVYGVGMAVIARLSTITFDTRMFYPLLPSILLGLALVLSVILKEVTRERRAMVFVAVALATASYVAVNARSAIVPRPRGSHELVADRLAGSVRAWIDQHMPADATIAATYGQATGYVLNRPTISFAPAEFSATEWTEEAVRRIMTAFGAQFLLVYPVAGEDCPVDRAQVESVFLTELARGEAPGWLEPAAASESVRVFRRGQ